MSDLLTWATDTYRKDDVIVLAKLYTSGMSITEIADKYGVSKQAIRNRLADFMPSMQYMDSFRRAYVAEQIRNFTA